MLDDAGERRMPRSRAGDGIGIRAGGEQQLHHVGAARESRIDDRLPMLGGVGITANGGTQRADIACPDGGASRAMGLHQPICDWR